MYYNFYVCVCVLMKMKIKKKNLSDNVNDPGSEWWWFQTKKQQQQLQNFFQTQVFVCVVVVVVVVIIITIINWKMNEMNGEKKIKNEHNGKHEPSEWTKKERNYFFFLQWDSEKYLYIRSHIDDRMKRNNNNNNKMI